MIKNIVFIVIFVTRLYSNVDKSLERSIESFNDSSFHSGKCENNFDIDGVITKLRKFSGYDKLYTEVRSTNTYPHGLRKSCKFAKIIYSEYKKDPRLPGCKERVYFIPSKRTVEYVIDCFPYYDTQRVKRYFYDNGTIRKMGEHEPMIH